jgi:hypothetical protein
MKQKKPSPVGDFVENYRAAKVKSEAATEAHRAVPGVGNMLLRGIDRIPETDLALLVRERQAAIKRHEAEELEAKASLAARDALDQSDVASGDADALASDPQHLADDLTANDAKRRLLRAELEALDRADRERYVQAVDAYRRRCTKRNAEGLPLPKGPPMQRLGEPYLTTLRRSIATPDPVPSRAEAIAGAKHEITTYSAELQRRHVEREEKAKETEWRRELRAQEAQASNERMRAQAEKDQRAADEAREKKEQLAREYFARTAVGD